MGTDLVIGESQQVSKVYVVEGLLSSSNWFLVIGAQIRLASKRLQSSKKYLVEVLLSSFNWLLDARHIHKIRSIL